MYFRSPVMRYMRAQTAGDMKSASHHHHSMRWPMAAVEFSGVSGMRGTARIASSATLVSAISAGSLSLK